jgi:hypothetical protein
VPLWLAPFAGHLNTAFCPLFSDLLLLLVFWWFAFSFFSVEIYSINTIVGSMLIFLPVKIKTTIVSVISIVAIILQCSVAFQHAWLA